MPDAKLLNDTLETTRRELLDLTTRNRLLSTPRTSTRSGRVEIVDAVSHDVFQLLVQEKAALTFLPKPQADPENETDPRFAQPDEVAADESQPATGAVKSAAGAGGPADVPVEHSASVPAVALDSGAADPGSDDDRQQPSPAGRGASRRLQTQLTSETLQRRLLRMFYDARTFEEEQGVSILYLALGFLKWYEDERSDQPRYAPLLLVPVQLERRSATSKFSLRYIDDEINTNLSLQMKLKADFGIQLPDVPDSEDLSPDDYFQQVARAVQPRSRWQVLPNDIVLWFFSFSKFLMYRDLQPDTWPAERPLNDHQLVASLLQDDGFQYEPLFHGENERIDDVLPPLDQIHVMDADSSQTIAIDEVRRGRNLVIQGPPGTGKSQTIANLIATAVKDGKKVLFVAEKMAALEVVKRRLDSLGLGDMCLELHSHKANKRAVLEELSRTLDLGRPKCGNVAQQAKRLQDVAQQLNRHADMLHSYLEPAHVTPYQALGHLVQLRNEGLGPSDFQLQQPLAWSAADFRQKQNLVADLAAHVQQLGPPREHPWRGVQQTGFLPTDMDRLGAELPEIIERLKQLHHAAGELAQRLDVDSVETLFDCAAAARLGQHLAAAPPLDCHGMGHEVWTQQRGAIDQLVETGKRWQACRQELEPLVADVAWSTDVALARRTLAAHGTSWLRFLAPSYYKALATLRGILKGQPPKSLDQRLALLDRLMEEQAARQALENDQPLGREAFGRFWRGTGSDWSALQSICDWESQGVETNVPASYRRMAGTLDGLEPLGQLAQQIRRDLQWLVKRLHPLLKKLQLDAQDAFDRDDWRRVPLPMLADRLAAWRASPERLSQWNGYFLRRQKMAEEGMAELAARLDQGKIPPQQASASLQMAYYEELLRESYRQNPELATFNGLSHQQQLQRFRTLDRQRLEMAREEVAMAHYEGLPRQGGHAGEVGLLRREMKKKRRHLPLRRLLQEAGHAVQAIKPVLMMSPISIAQYLEPGVLQFDLLLMDEASQVRPVEALGAIARSRQMVVVGDERQLPPTQFFNRLMGDEGYESDEFQVGHIESILGLCEAKNVPRCRLRWHYRSRHQSLIAVSNREFYDDQLYVVPSPFQECDELGLKFHHVPNGVFDRGGSATNVVEAQEVVAAVLRHARDYPDQTLGVAAFSVAQRNAILDELELHRRETPELESFFANGTPEPFFVKNLENVQGDERDVIFISIGYGRDKSGYMAMNFGPLNNEGGERRLNVLITRARQRCQVFSSITADDIDLQRTQARGTQALKTFLRYAQCGHMDIAVRTGMDYDSPFERQVSRAVSRLGYHVHTQVGVAGFRIDLAVLDPDTPGRYLLGIECDGASYHSSRSARDRDRLRQQVLEDRGWVIHRIWSTDWFQRPEDQLQRTAAAIEQAKVQWSTRPGRSAARDASPPTANIPRHEENGDDDESDFAAVPYQEAEFTNNHAAAIHTLPVNQLARVVTKIVRIEGPIHQDEVVRRVASLWGLKRSGRRIAEAVDAALQEATYKKKLVQHGLFFRPARQVQVPIRNRENVSSSHLRRPEYLPPEEIRAALIYVIDAHLGMSSEEAVVSVARLLGFRTTTSNLREVIEDELLLLADEGLLENRNGKLYHVPVQKAVGSRQ